MLLSAFLFEKDYWSGVSVAWWQVLLVVLVVVAVVAAALLAISYVSKRKGIAFERSTRDLTYGAICLAASYALSFIPIYSLPNGGTVTPASALPLLIYCYYFGFRKSLVVSTAYALLQLIQKPYIVSPYSALLDYIVPFMAFSLAGVFPFKPSVYAKTVAAKRPLLAAHARFLIGVGLYFVVRYCSHVLAGVLFWSNGIDFLGWSGDLGGAVAWGYSLTYNLLFLLPDTALAAAVGGVLLSSKTFNAFMATSRHAHKNADTAEEHDERAGAGRDERQRQAGGRNGAGDDGNVDQDLYGDNAGHPAG